MKLNVSARKTKNFRDKHLTGQNLNKLEVAEIHIDTAITMLFNNMNPVSIHTVVSSGYQIIRDISKKEDTEEYFMITSRIKEEYLNEFWSHINKAWSFIKHADRDSTSTFEGVDERVNDFAILMSIKLLGGLGRKVSPAMHAFTTWFACLWPDLLTENEFRDFIQKNYEDCNVEQFSREEVLHMGKLVLQGLHTPQ